MITKHQLPVWPEDDSTKYFKTYNKIIQNFEQAFEVYYPQTQILFIDNTYLNVEQICSVVMSNQCDVVVIFSFVDPPYPWHYLDEVLSQKFPNLIKRFIGNESPDIDIPFFWLLTVNEMQQYQTLELLPDQLDLVYLNYNNKPHEHRTRLLHELEKNNLLQFGHSTMAQDLSMENNRVQNLGPLDLWRRHFLNIDNATVFRIGNDHLLLTEKEFKPLLGLRPFVINGSPRYYQVLEKLGFDLFTDIIPINQLSMETDDVDTTMQHCHKVICDLIRELSQENLHLLYDKILPRLLDNRNHVIDHGRYLVDKWCNQTIDLKKS